MAGTRTAPTVGDLTVTKSTATLHLVDAAGDLTTDAIVSAGAIDTIDVEALAAAYQPNTQASLWKVSLTSEWEGDIDPDNATALARYQISDGINLLWKDSASLTAITPRVYAPVAAIMQGNQDIPLLSPQIFADLVAAYQEILSGYSLTSAQFTTRRERRNNPRIRV